MTADEPGRGSNTRSTLEPLRAEPAPSRLPMAWQPITPRGVAAFAGASLGRLFLVQFVVALLAAVSVVWFLAIAWFPTIREAIRKLPEQGQIRGQELQSPWVARQPLAVGHFLAFVIDLEQGEGATPVSHLAVKFHRRGFQICSLPGCLAFAYPKGWVIEFNRTELEPWWGAWQPIILGVAAVLVIVSLLLVWALLATVWSGLARLAAWFGHRTLTWGASWRLAAAALMPGAIVFILALWLYGLQVLDFISFGILFALHLVLGPIYSCVGPLFLPGLRSPEQCLPRNPFAPTRSEEESSDGPRG